MNRENTQEKNEEKEIHRIDEIGKSQITSLPPCESFAEGRLLPLEPQTLQLYRGCLEGNVVQTKKLIRKIGAIPLIVKGELLKQFKSILTQALWQACMCSNHANGLEMITYLVDKGADIDLMDENGNALSRCCMSGQLEGLTFLLSKGASLSTVNDQGQNLIHYCCLNGAAELLNIFLNKSKSSIEFPLNALDSHGKTPLHYARNWGIITLLVKAGADVNARDFQGWSPLMQASCSGNVQTVSALLAMGANVHLMAYPTQESPQGYPAIFLAIAYIFEEKMENKENRKGIEIFNCLIQNGAKKEERYLGMTPLMWACVENHLELATILLDRFANPFARSTLNRANSLLILCANPSPGIGKIAELFKPFLKSLNRDSETELVPLFLAIDTQNVEMVQWLLSNGADSKILDEQGRTPLERAQSIDPSSKICTLLKKYHLFSETPK